MLMPVEGGGTAKEALAASIHGERARLAHLLGDATPSSPADLDIAAGACLCGAASECWTVPFGKLEACHLPTC